MSETFLPGASNTSDQNPNPDEVAAETLPSFEAVRALFEVFYAKHSFDVLRALQHTSREQPLRRRDLDARLPGTPERAIFNALVSLGKSGLVNRTGLDEGVGAFYFLSDTGHELLPLVEEVGNNCHKQAPALRDAVATKSRGSGASKHGR